MNSRNRQPKARVLSGDGQRVPDSPEGVADKADGGVRGCGQHAANKERSAASMDGPRNDGTPEGPENRQLSALDVVTETAKDRPNSTTGLDGRDNEDITDGILRREAHTYDRLDRGRPSSQHLYRPIVDNSKGRPANRDTDTNSKPSTSYASRSPHGATSPLYDTCAVEVLPSAAGSESSRPFLHKGGKHFQENADDIIELQSDAENAATSPEESQNKSNAKKDKPEITNIPNTNFAIACMVAMCFNLPFGVLAMYFSLRAVKAYQDGRAKLGEKRSRWSIVLSLLGITITTVIISSVVLYTATQGHKRISRNKAYGSKSGLNL